MDTPRWSRATGWSYGASAVCVAIWVTLVVFNRVSQGGVTFTGEYAGLLAASLWVWAAVSLLATVLAVVGIVRSRPKGAAVVAVILALFLVTVGILSWY